MKIKNLPGQAEEGTTSQTSITAVSVLLDPSDPVFKGSFTNRKSPPLWSMLPMSL
jgi:hypothetical protein